MEGDLTSGKLAIFTKISCGDFMEIWPIWFKASFPSAVTTVIWSRDPRGKKKKKLQGLRIQDFSSPTSKSLSIQILLILRGPLSMWQNGSRGFHRSSNVWWCKELETSPKTRLEFLTSNQACQGPGVPDPEYFPAAQNFKSWNWKELVAPPAILLFTKQETSGKSVIFCIFWIPTQLKNNYLRGFNWGL